MRIKNVLFFLLPILGLVLSCSDDPNSVGNVLVPENDRLKTLTLDSHTDSFEQVFESYQEQSIYYGSASRVLLGSYNNITSEALINFSINLPDSIEDPLESSDSVKIIESWIEIHPNYWLGDSSNFSFTAQEINTSWNPIDINEDTVTTIRNSLGANILSEISYDEGDSVLKFTINDDVVKNWVYESFDDSYPDNNGLLLAPVSNSGILGFQAITVFPQTPFPTIFLVFEKEGDFIDTVRAQPTLDLHLPSGEPITSSDDELVFQGSIAMRGKLKFDLTTVPNDILVNSAILNLSVNKSNSFEATVPTDTVAARFLYNFESDSIKFEFGRYPISKSNGVYSGEIRQFVQRWLDGEPNEGFDLRLSDENRSASAISFYSSTNPVDSLRPRLTIYYTTK